MQLKNSILGKQNVPVRTSILKSPPPQNLTIMYGIKNAAITRYRSPMLEILKLYTIFCFLENHSYEPQIFTLNYSDAYLVTYSDVL